MTTTRETTTSRETSDRSHFGHDSTTDEVLEGLSLSGKHVLVTGGTAGLGVETVRALAAAGASVTLTARDLDRGNAVAESIREATGNLSIDAVALELGHLESVRQCADKVLDKHPAISILINNAGVMATPQLVTDDGFELQFGTNHLGHFLLTNLLVPALTAGAPSRVVSLSSRAHHMDGVNFDDIDFQYRDYNKWIAYAQSKTANVLFTVALEQRLAGRGVHAYAVHPGVIETELSRHMDADDRAMIQQRGEQLGGMQMKSIPAGAATSVFAATAPELEGRGGVYLEDCHVAEVNDEPDAAEGVRSWAIDPDKAERLWALSEHLVGQQFHL